jgi:hypothetical protein
MPVADRALVQEVTTIGVESVPGTAVPADVKLNGVMIELDTALEVDRFGPAGNLWDTIAAPRQEWATGSLTGYPNYCELPYIFSNVFGAATITTPTGAVNARRWHWKPSSNTPWTPLTWTIRRGVPNNSAESASYGLLSGIGLSFSRTAQPEISGDLFAYALDYAAAIVTTGLSAIQLIPILPTEICVYLNSSFATIGTTLLTRDFLASFEITDLFGPFWPLNCTIDSFGGHAPLKPGATATLQLGNDTQGRDMVTPMRTGDTRYLRIESTGPTVDIGPPAYTHRLRMDFALKVVEAPTRGDADGLSTLEWGFAIIDDSSFGGALEITLDTNVSAL